MLRRVTTVAPHIGKRIRAARKEAGFRNTEQFAVYLNVSYRTLQRWEQSDDIRISSLIRIAQATGKPLSYFLVEPDRRP